MERETVEQFRARGGLVKVSNTDPLNDETRMRWERKEYARKRFHKNTGSEPKRRTIPKSSQTEDALSGLSAYYDTLKI